MVITQKYVALLNWIQTHRKWLIPTAMAIILIFLLFSIALHLQHRRQQAREEAIAAKNQAPIAEKATKQPARTAREPRPEKHEQPAGLPPEMIPEGEISTYAAEPSPDEVTRKIEATNSYERKEEEEKIKDVPVVWPLYFFSIMKQEQDTAKVMLDASENGFGVIIVTEISLKRYAGILSAQPGDKVWLAGKISAIDTQGTGQITLVMDYLGFSGQDTPRNVNQER